MKLLVSTVALCLVALSAARPDDPYHHSPPKHEPVYHSPPKHEPVYHAPKHGYKAVSNTHG